MSGAFASPVLSAAFVQGWLMTAGLIVAIGAQNALVLQQGLRRTHVGPVVALCTASDWLLIALGVFGFGDELQRLVAFHIEAAHHRFVVGEGTTVDDQQFVFVVVPAQHSHPL